MRFLENDVVEPATIAFRRWENGDVIGLTRLVPHFWQAFDGPYYVVHRAHLQQAMYQIALNLGVKVNLNAWIMAYNVERPLITLDNGEAYNADLVVAADGLCILPALLVAVD